MFLSTVPAFKYRLNCNRAFCSTGGHQKSRSVFLLQQSEGKSHTSSVQASFILVKVFLENRDRLLGQLQQGFAVDKSVLGSTQTPELEDGLNSVAGGLWVEHISIGENQLS
jgi:hypothetical protein